MQTELTERRKFAALDRPDRFGDIIAREMRERIKSGELPPGERLPSENELAMEFDVSRPVVREAISQLKVDGVVATRPGAGAFVAEFSNHNAFRISARCFEKRSELVKILELQVTVSADAARLAADKRDAAQLAGMWCCYQGLEAALATGTEGLRQWLDCEFDLYARIAEASGNGFFLEFLNMINGRIVNGLQIAALNNVRVAEFTPEVLREHLGVLEAIEAGAPTLAADRARIHFENAAHRTAARGDLRD